MVTLECDATEAAEAYGSMDVPVGSPKYQRQHP